jgi:hypothetical protein
MHPPEGKAMTRRIALLTLLVAAALAGACLSSLFARDEKSTNWDALKLRCAEANFELAQARLAQAESENKLAAGTITPDTVELLQAGVKLTGEQLQQLQGKGGADAFAPQIAAAASLVQALESDHNESLQANKLQPGSVAEPQLRREQAEINVAKARLAALQSLPQQPLEARLEWEISQLQDDIRALWARPLIQD